MPSVHYAHGFSVYFIFVRRYRRHQVLIRSADVDVISFFAADAPGRTTDAQYAGDAFVRTDVLLMMARCARRHDAMRVAAYASTLMLIDEPDVIFFDV